MFPPSKLEVLKTCSKNTPKIVLMKLPHPKSAQIFRGYSMSFIPILNSGFDENSKKILPDRLKPSFIKLSIVEMDDPCNDTEQNLENESTRKSSDSIHIKRLSSTVNIVKKQNSEQNIFLRKRLGSEVLNKNIIRLVRENLMKALFE